MGYWSLGTTIRMCCSFYSPFRASWGVLYCPKTDIFLLLVTKLTIAKLWKKTSVSISQVRWKVSWNMIHDNLPASSGMQATILKRFGAHGFAICISISNLPGPRIWLSLQPSGILFSIFFFFILFRFSLLFFLSFFYWPMYNLVIVIQFFCCR